MSAVLLLLVCWVVSSLGAGALWRCPTACTSFCVVPWQGAWRSAYKCFWCFPCQTGSLSVCLACRWSPSLRLVGLPFVESSPLHGTSISLRVPECVFCGGVAPKGSVFLVICVTCSARLRPISWLFRCISDGPAPIGSWFSAS